MRPTGTSTVAVRTMAVARGVIGVAIYVAPDATTRLLGLDPAPNRQLRLMNRLWGARDVALAVALLSTDGQTRRVLFHTCVAIEACDALSTLIARRSGTITPRATATALGAVAAAAIPEAVALAAGARR